MDRQGSEAVRMHYAAAAVMAGIYLYNLPLMIALIWRRDGFGVGLGVFGGRGAVRRAVGRVGKGGGFDIGKARRALRVLAKMLARMRLEHFSARLRVGAGDAAQTALLCGGIAAAAHALRGAAESGKVDVRADFTGAALEGEVRAVARLELGRLVRSLAESI